MAITVYQKAATTKEQSMFKIILFVLLVFFADSAASGAETMAQR